MELEASNEYLICICKSAIINMIDIHLGWPLTDLWTLCTCRTIVLQNRKEFKQINQFIHLNSVLICRTIVRHVHKVHKFKRINQFIPLNSVLICRTIVRHVHKVHKSVSGHPRWISIILIIAVKDPIQRFLSTIACSNMIWRIVHSVILLWEQQTCMRVWYFMSSETKYPSYRSEPGRGLCSLLWI